MASTPPSKKRALEADQGSPELYPTFGLGKTQTLVSTVSHTPSKAKVQETCVFQNLPEGNTKPRFGNNAIDVRDVYEKYERPIEVVRDEDTDLFKGLPGIYVITPCQTAEQQPCVATREVLIKVGNAVDLATRFDGYHTYFPYGFTILRVYVLVREEKTSTGKTHRLFKKFELGDRGLRSMIDTAETHVLRFVHYDLDFKKLVITRPARSEWFRADLQRESLKDSLEALDDFVTSLKLLPPKKRKKTSSVYGKFIKECCEPARFSVDLRLLSKTDERLRFKDVPDAATTATMVRKGQFAHVVGTKAEKQAAIDAKKAPVAAVIEDKVVDVDGNEVKEVKSARERRAEARAQAEQPAQPAPKKLKVQRVLLAGFIDSFFNVGDVS